MHRFGACESDLARRKSIWRAQGSFGGEICGREVGGAGDRAEYGVACGVAGYGRGAGDLPRFCGAERASREMPVPPFSLLQLGPKLMWRAHFAG
jgi:hypothetical protein